jgi:23S rRNA pseudouridine1911/1915/1917 synthase
MPQDLSHPMPLAVLAAAAEWLAVAKPAGPPVHAGPGEPSVLAALAACRVGPLLPVHRLDAATSGVLLLARNPAAARVLAAAFAARAVRKTYLGVVQGRPQREEGEIFTHLAPPAGANPRGAVVEPGAGPPALTHFRVLAAAGDRALLELAPLTGRTHQLRLHLRHLGHPLLGDPLYARPDTPPAARLMLHAWRLDFPDPVTGRQVRASAPPPPEFGEFPLPEASAGASYPPS